jgi:hypothetical protein
LLPIFRALARGNPSETALQSGPLWPLVFVLSCAPAAGMNLVQETIFDDVPTFSVPFLLALTSAVQFGFVAACIWTDAVPHFGASGSLHALGEHLAYGFECFFSPDNSDNPRRCHLCAPIGLLFLASYAASYFFGSRVVRASSANFQSLLVNLASALCIYFWIALPAVNRWSDGKTYTPFEVACTSSALLPIVAGTMLFRHFEPPTEREAACADNLPLAVQDELPRPAPTNMGDD